jgi:filamentous hemagglutinin
LSSARALTDQTIESLTRATAKGDPAIALVDLDRGRHFVVVDGVTSRQGQKVVAIRDPANGRQYFTPVEEFSERFSGEAVLTNPK